MNYEIIRHDKQNDKHSSSMGLPATFIEYV